MLFFYLVCAQSARPYSLGAQNRLDAVGAGGGLLVIVYSLSFETGLDTTARDGASTWMLCMQLVTVVTPGCLACARLLPRR